MVLYRRPVPAGTEPVIPLGMNQTKSGQTQDKNHKTLKING